MHELPLTRLIGTGLLLVAILMMVGLTALAEALHPYGLPAERTLNRH